MATPEQLADEARRALKVRHIVDIATSLIQQSRFSRTDAEILVRHVRDGILRLFPDGTETYEVVYAPRFRRLIDEFAAPVERPGVVLPFRPKAK
jgi:hypothetical protein